MGPPNLANLAINRENDSNTLVALSQIQLDSKGSVANLVVINSALYGERKPF